MRHASCLSGLIPGRSLPKNHCAAVFYEVSSSLMRLVGLARIDRPACRIRNVRLPYLVRKPQFFKVPLSLPLQVPDIAHPPPSGWSRGRTSLNYQLFEMNQALDATVAAEELAGTQAHVAKPTPLPLPLPPKYVEEEVQKRIELRVSQSFFEAVKLLAETEGITRADVIRKAVSLYARARIEQKQGNCIAFARVGSDNNMEIVDLLSVI